MAIRVTQGMTNRSYLYNLNTAQYNMNKSSEKLQTGRKYNRASEDVHGATKCLALRSKLYRNDKVQEGVSQAINELKMSESALEEISSIASEVQSEMIKAMDEVKLGSANSTFLAFIKETKEEVLRLANSQYNDKYLLGGQNVTQEPFSTYEEDGHSYLLFNGQYKVSDIYSSKVSTTDERYYQDNLELRDALYTYANNDDVTLTINQAKRKEAVNNLKSGILNYYNNKYDFSTLNEVKGYNFTSCWMGGKGHEEHVQKFIDANPGFAGVGLDQIVNEMNTLISNAESKLSDGNVYAVNKELDANGETVINLVASKSNGSYTKNVTQEFYYEYDGKPIDNTHNNYIDIGLDMSSKSISSTSKFNITIDGLAALGFGKNSDTEISNNIYDMLTEMEIAIENKNVDRLGEVHEQFKKQCENLVSSYSEIGVRGHYLETTLSRLENENAILKESQSNMEATDDAAEITNFKGYQNAWNTVLQFGGSIFPKSLMDYVN